MVGIRSCKKKAYSMFHEFLGFPIGEKCLRVQVPGVILKERDRWASYIRGVFDTDGSVYARRTGRKSGKRHPVVDISSSSRRHLEQLHMMDRALGFNCWIESTHIRMGGWSTVSRFFREIRPHNLTHIKRMIRIYAGRGSQAWYGEGLDWAKSLNPLSANPLFARTRGFESHPLRGGCIVWAGEIPAAPTHSIETS